MSDISGPPLVSRLAGNPIVRPDMLPNSDGDNINGPSLIRAPFWLPNRLGNYYLYFAHHHGTYIRLAYADRLEGPWTVLPGGTLRLRDAPACRGHVASPDVHVDEGARQVRMYFHGPARSAPGQHTFVATSADGVRFAARSAMLGPFYFRVVRFGVRWIATAKGGQIFVSTDGVSPFDFVASPFPMRDRRGNAPGDLRHVALEPFADGLRIYFTRIGDRPERILRTLAVPGDDELRTWRLGSFEDVLAPVAEWEGAGLRLEASQSGAARGPENAVRDPAIYVEDGQTYLLYSVAGESGIAIAALTA